MDCSEDGVSAQGISERRLLSFPLICRRGRLAILLLSYPYMQSFVRVARESATQSSLLADPRGLSDG